MKKPDTSVKNLKVSSLTKNLLMGGIHDILQLTQLAEIKTGHAVGPSEILSRIKGFGPRSTMELLEATLYLLDEAVTLLEADEHAGKTKEFDADALPLVVAMVRQTTGSIGGRDQERLFAEIAYDFLEALRAEDRKRNHSKAFATGETAVAGDLL